MFLPNGKKYNHIPVILTLLCFCLTEAVEQLREKLQDAQAGEQEAKRQHAASERVLTRVRDERNKLQDSHTRLGEELKDV